MKKELLEIEQCISKGKYLLDEFKKNGCSKDIEIDVFRTEILFESLLNKIICIANDAICVENILCTNRIKREVLEIIYILEKGLK